MMTEHYPEENQEEARLEAARQQMPELFADWDPDPAVLDSPVASGRSLWHQACRDARGDNEGLEASPVKRLEDDRPLYWRRLATRAMIRAADPASLADILSQFERASRGYDDLQFSTEADRRILVTGFDPFRLDDNLDQSNPSGYLAMCLDGEIITAGEHTAEIRTCLIPVRYPDFDTGLIENLMARVNRDRPVDMVITVSMGRDGFDLERFPARRRSVEGPDNLGLMSGGSPDAPFVPQLADGTLEGPEFVEFSLPVTRMLQHQDPFTVTDNHVVTTLESGDLTAASLQDLDNQVSVRGSGGGYLSNEISYRVINWINRQGLDIPAGHIHTPKMAGYDRNALQAITTQCRQLVRSAAETLLT